MRFSRTQYFETGGHRGVYHDGWVAASFHGAPWIITGSRGFDNNEWALDNIEEDLSQSNDLSAENPEKLAELLALFNVEAGRNNVFPLDDRFVERATDPDRSPVTKVETRSNTNQAQSACPATLPPNCIAVSARSRPTSRSLTAGRRV